MTSSARPAPPPLGYREYWLLAFGLFLGLCLLKFGNPVVLDRQIPTPASLGELWSQPWPLRWSFGVLGLFGLVGLPLLIHGFQTRVRRVSPWLWAPLVIWYGWQLMSASQTVDRTLTGLTLFHLAGVVLTYAFGLWVVTSGSAIRWLLVGILAGFCLCLMRATTQRLVEFPADRELLLEGQRTGWTNFTPALVIQMKQEGTIITTNGVDLANPVILSKLERGRVHGTLVYPNALAGAVLLLLPVALQLIGTVIQDQRPMIRWAALGLLTFLGFAALLWSGSKSGWLIALVMGVAWVFRLGLPKAWRWGLLCVVVVGGLIVFGLRFQGYFAAGATSVGARFDYWKAAGQTALEHPVLGSGPGTFQRPYARLKAPDAEMARLTHNDYLQQFSDSGWIGGLSYLTWALAWAWWVGRWAWEQPEAFWFALFLGVSAWLIQGLSEFALYVPALAWTAFTLAGALAAAATSVSLQPTKS